jgi:peptidoglycan hydrolase-like protein with peptidoglycan-binding domain
VRVAACGALGPLAAAILALSAPPATAMPKGAGLSRPPLASGASAVRAHAQAGPSSSATVREAQQLFRVLGYPVRRERPGVLGTDTRGALSYFQRKYRLPVNGKPTAATLAKMRAVASALRASGRPSASAQPHDLVEDVLGNGVPILAIAVALAAILGALALSARAADTIGPRAGADRRRGP